MLRPRKTREWAHEELQGRRIRQALQKVEEANPAPQGSEVLVRITAAGVCHSDVHLWEGYFDMGGGNKVLDREDHGPPRTMGHEIVGEVVALGPDAKGAKVGDKAVVYPWIGCGKCWYCQNGIEHLCPTPRALGVNKDGGYADHVLVPDAKYLYPYGNLPTELACLYACSGITAFGAVKKAVGQDAGKPILVIGAGGVGLMGVRFAKSVLGREPIVADIDEGKRKLALENGAIAALDPRDKEARKQVMELTGGTGVGAAIDFVGAESLGPVRPARARPRRTADHRRPVRRHLLHARCRCSPSPAARSWAR